MYKALTLAVLAHNGQLRKYTNDPYIIHPIAVAEIVNKVTLEKDMIRAAFLHDTVEDTDITIDFLQKHFNERVALLVEEVTDVSKPEDGNRATRRLIDLKHTALASPDAKTIKLADVIHNTGTILQYDPNFAKVYMKEKKALLGVLTEGDSSLYEHAEGVIEKYYHKIKLGNL